MFGLALVVWVDKKTGTQAIETFSRKDVRGDFLFG